MNAHTAKGRPPSRPGQPPYSQSNQNLLLEKVNARTSTPDSEALASSEDEGDHRGDTQYQPHQASKPARRPSWLNDMSQPITKPRKGSFANSMSPTASHPSTPSAEANSAGPWGSHSSSSILGRGTGAPAFSWGTGIWNSNPKDAPSRLAEVLPSPTSTFAPGGGANSFFPESGFSPGGRDANPNSQIPFAIPLHPTPKTYRSQSYSVGQLDPEIPPPAGSVGSSGTMGRARHPGLQHRPSRPSMLSEMANDGSMLGKVKEVEDDEDGDSLEDSLQGSFHQSSESKTIEMLTRENAMLRQQYQGRLRSRASIGNGYPLQETVPEESDFAVDEFQDENHEGLDSFARRAANRRMSEYGSATLRSPLSLERGKTDSANLKKALWSSSLGFPVGDASQSRRHSFANMPTRQGSISSIADATAALDASAADGQAPQDFTGAIFENGAYLAPNPAYFMGGSGMTAAVSSAYSNPYGNFNPAYANRPPSPHRNMYPMGQPRQNQLLYVVLFKCARADVFYIQEGTGLTVKPGDLVIVEADRGTDLGTVAKDNVDWQTARELKEHYAEEHYKWLIMYSNGPAAASEASALGSSNGGSAIGGMGPPNQFHLQEPNSGELRPKLIKRLAQSHEISSLRDKEGQEAKAKRMCMQKVKEHGLNMEILDAEFQMDWKKLTFYYFADAYINFNSLVTDLFKIYKTRIWMSAINPASFASPALGVQAPSGIGPGAVSAGRGSSNNDRRHNQPSHRNAQPYGPSPQAAQSFRPPFTDPFGTDRAMQGNQQYPASFGFGQPGPFGPTRPDANFMAGMPPGMPGYPSSSYQAVPDYQPRFPNSGSATSPVPHSQGASPIASSGDWAGAFQGLSLNGN